MSGYDEYSRLRITRREREALTLAGAGLSNREVAEAMHLREGTVKQYLYRAFDKVGVDSRTQIGQLPPESRK